MPALLQAAIDSDHGDTLSQRVLPEDNSGALTGGR